MKSRETLIRLKKFQVDEKRRRVSQIEGMIADFQRMSVDLEREIQSEQDRAGINDPSHFAYPTYAKAAIQRRENLTRSADELRIQLEDAKSLLGVDLALEINRHALEVGNHALDLGDPSALLVDLKLLQAD